MTVKTWNQELFIVLIALYSVLTTTRGFAYPAKENNIQNAEPLALPLSLYGFPFHEAIPQSTQADTGAQRNCYHFYVSRNMSSLLSDATKMLRQVHDKREREWILTFIYRIKSLAEHLRSHPDSQNYEECMLVEGEERKKPSILSEALRIPQPELYFVDDMMPNQNQKRSVSDAADSKDADNKSAIAQSSQESHNRADEDNHASQQVTTEKKEQSTSNVKQQKESENYNSVAESTSESVSLKKDVEGQHSSDSVPTAAGAANSELMANQDSEKEAASSNPEEEDWMIGKGGDDSAIIVSSPEPGCLSEEKCREVIKRLERQGGVGRQGEDELERELHARRRKNAEDEQKHQQLLKERIRKALLEELAPEIKKLRTVGGTQEDLIELWKQSEIEIAKEEARKRQENDFDYEEDGAAAGDLNSNDKNHPNYRTVAPSSDQVENYKKPSDELPYVHNDVLVQQLYDAGRDEEPLYRSTRALDPKDEYLIISTHIPY